MTGFSEVIPVFDAVFYQLDDRVPLERPVAFVKSIVELEVNGVKMDASFEVGPSWGETHKVAEFPDATKSFTTGQFPEYEALPE
jgi:hypothetical protein